MVQACLIVGVIFIKITKDEFELQIACCGGVLIVILNFTMTYLYFKQTGMPYKSQQHAKNLSHCGYVALYWTLAFILKFITAFIKEISPDNIVHPKIPGSADDGEAEQVFYAICYFSLCLLCDIVPFLIVVDSQFIKIFTFDLVVKFR